MLVCMKTRAEVPLALLVAVAACASCSRSKAADPAPEATAPAKSGAATTAGATPRPAEDPAKVKARLGVAYGAIRCELLGQTPAAPGRDVYKDNGFEDPASYAAAFSAAAKADPKWAEALVKQAISNGCPK